MSEHSEVLNREAEKGLPDGLGAENTQPGADASHLVVPDSLVFGLGSPDTQAEAGDPGHIPFDHSGDAVDSGLPVGLGADSSQSGPPSPHHTDADSTEYGLGSADTQHVHV